ncbi:MAG: hypothetical protein OEZ33_10135, partial [Gammaproteobacteria bacterium]|nr:hypothetical protein [Gammaproteobacteria bacterium]
MDEKIRVTWQDLSVGRRLPWNVYAESGKLLLGVGHIIPNQAMLDNMRQYVMYRDEIPESYLSESGGPGETSPFALMDELVSRLNGICKDIEAGEKNAGENIVRLVKDLMNMCATEPDASIATIHVPNKYSYSLYHSIQCAVICVLLGMKTKMPVKD